MKIVSKFIMCSCIFIYFVGIYYIALKFGLIKLISKYGLSEMFNEIPKSFPNMKYFYWALLLYTIIYAIIVYFIYKYLVNNEKEMVELQNNVTDLKLHADELQNIISKYRRDHNNSEYKTIALTKLERLQRQVRALPTSVMKNPTFDSELSSMINKLKEIMESGEDNILVATLDECCDNVRFLQTKCMKTK